MAESARRRLTRGASAPLYKQNSWSPDILREEAWANRRINQRHRRGRSVTDDDLEELRGCLDLGFSFESPDLDPKLSSTFPALPFYKAVSQRWYSNSLSRSVSASLSDCESASSFTASPASIVDPGEQPEIVKTRLKQWAQVVACSVRQLSHNSCHKADSWGALAEEKR